MGVLIHATILHEVNPLFIIVLPFYSGNSSMGITEQEGLLVHGAYLRRETIL